MNNSRKEMQQKKPHTLQEYLDSGCTQMRLASGIIDPLGVMLVHETRGLMCNGCVMFQQGCKAVANLVSGTRVATATSAGETVREEAARRNLPISQIRRERNGG